MCVCVSAYRKAKLFKGRFDKGSVLGQDLLQVTTSLHVPENYTHTHKLAIQRNFIRKVRKVLYSTYDIKLRALCITRKVYCSSVASRLLALAFLLGGGLAFTRDFVASPSRVAQQSFRSTNAWQN